MKRTIEIVLAALLVAGLSTGCKNEQTDDTTDTTATAATTTTENETTEDSETTAEEEADAATAEVEVDEPMYIKAAYEVTCVKAKIEDPEKQTAILAEVYPRYGFENAEAFAAAEAQMKDSESVKMALEEKMKGCTVEVAEGFETAGAADTEGTEEAAKEDAPKKPSLGYKPGSYKGTVSGGGITDGKVTVAVRADGKATGVFTGKREGKGFLISVKGEVGKDGKFRMKGGKGNTAMITGTVKGEKANGKIDGLINKQKYTVAFTAE